jgi:hypothetical protein
MITVSIGSETRSFSDSDEHWITQQIGRRRQDKLPACATVRVAQGDIDLNLVTPGCSSGGGGSTRRLSHGEEKILDLWQKHGLNNPDFAPGELVAFLKQLKREL